MVDEDRQQVIQICKFMEDYHFFQVVIFIAIDIIKLFSVKQQLSFGKDHLSWCCLTYSFFPSFIYFCNFSSLPLLTPSFHRFPCLSSLSLSHFSCIFPSSRLFPSISHLPSSLSLSFLLFRFLLFLSRFLLFLSWFPFFSLDFLSSLSISFLLSRFPFFSLFIYFSICAVSKNVFSLYRRWAGRPTRERETSRTGGPSNWRRKKKPREVEIEKIDGRTDWWCPGCLEVSLER